MGTVVNLAAARRERARRQGFDRPRMPVWTWAGLGLWTLSAIGAAQLLLWFARGIAWAASLAPQGF